MVNLVIWNEFVHEQEDEHVKSIYPDGIHGSIKQLLSDDINQNIKTATLEEKEHGLTEELLDKTDVLIWWGHKAHKLVEDKIVDRVQQRILGSRGGGGLDSGGLSGLRLNRTQAGLRLQGEGSGLRGFSTDRAIDDAINDANVLLAFEVNYNDGPWIDIKEQLKKYNGLLKYSQPVADGTLSWTPSM